MTIATLLFALIALPTSHAGAGDPLMLDFTAAGCGPCRQMRPVVEQLIQKGYPIKPVDLYENRELAERYEVTAVPTFVVIDPASGREIGRLSGARPASDLVSLYNEARAELRPAIRTRPQVADERDHDDQGAADRDADDEPEPAKGRRDTKALSPNPKPWETVVRIKVHGAGVIGLGSGTLIYSTPKEAIILTCAHIFHLENGPQAHPSRFPRKITVDLFDGNLGGPARNQVHYAKETFVGEAIDYDFQRDVGLIRIRPGRRLPFARVVPAYWKPEARMGMVTVGCSEGHDATAWDTVIVNPSFRGLAGKTAYEAIECVTAPKQGRSGGGLFTHNGYVAGVCDFAEPQGNHGLYASPRSIYAILDRNEMMALYAPARGGPATMLANNRPAAGRAAEPIARGQSPDRDDPGAVSLPPPEMVGIEMSGLAPNDDRATPRRRGTWQPPTPSDLKMDPSADADPFAQSGPSRTLPVTELATTPTPAPRTSGSTWRASRSPWRELSTAGAR